MRSQCAYCVSVCVEDKCVPHRRFFWQMVAEVRVISLCRFGGHRMFVVEFAPAFRGANVLSVGSPQCFWSGRLRVCIN